VNLTLSPQLRLILLVGGLAVVMMFGMMLFVARGALLAEEADPAPIVHEPRVTKAKPAATKASVATIGKPATKSKAPVAAKSTAKPKVAAAAAPRAQTAPKPTAAPKPVAPGKPKPSVLAQNGLPLPIMLALKAHRVVVVALVVPGAELDELAVAEAQAGAKAAGAGFVTLNVLRDAIGRPLARKLGVIQTPALLVYRRPANVVVRFEGFADRDTVAQAVASALAGR
jgi:hypothetical protein